MEEKLADCKLKKVCCKEVLAGLEATIGQKNVKLPNKLPFSRIARV